ncbi:MAG: hypothetical protein ACLUAO_00625 [Streptococcus sp.]
MIFLCDYYNQASKDLAYSLFMRQATMPQQLSSIQMAFSLRSSLLSPTMWK